MFTSRSWSFAESSVAVVMFGGVADVGGMVRSVGAFAAASLQITRSFVVAVCVVCIP